MAKIIVDVSDRTKADLLIRIERQSKKEKRTITMREFVLNALGVCDV